MIDKVYRTLAFFPKELVTIGNFLRKTMKKRRSVRRWVIELVLFQHRPQLMITHAKQFCSTALVECRLLQAWFPQAFLLLFLAASQIERWLSPYKSRQ